jgi:DNA-binding IclR family transcriptional regulator
MTSVAAPISGPAGTVLAAISVVAPAESTRASEMRPAVLTVAQAISRAMTTTP